MTMKSILLELARNPDFPEGSTAHGYAFHAPLTPDGMLDKSAFGAHAAACSVRRFWAGEPQQLGQLKHRRDGSWLFHYSGMDSDEDEPIFKFDRHHFVEGEYVSVTEHDGMQRTFRVASVK
jgi:hypothetical protein